MARGDVDGCQEGRVGVVAAQHVIEVPARQALDQVEAVADGIQIGRQQAGEEQVGVSGPDVVLVGHPVEAEHAFEALDAVVGEHDVVAGFRVVVVVAGAADDDVVAGMGAVLERCAEVAL